MIGNENVSDVKLRLVRRGQGMLSESHDIWLNRSMITHRFGPDEETSHATGANEPQILQKLIKSNPNGTVSLDITDEEGLTANQEENFKLLVDCLRAFFAYIYTGRFVHNLTIYEMELVQRLASAVGFKRLAKKLAQLTLMLQRQVKLTLAKDLTSLEQSTQRVVEATDQHRLLIQIYAEKLSKLEGSSQLAAKRFEKFYKKHKMPVAEVSAEQNARSTLL